MGPDPDPDPEAEAAETPLRWLRRGSAAAQAGAGAPPALRFRVLKEIRQLGVRRVQPRVLEVDVAASSVRNLSPEGRLRKVFHVNQVKHLLRVQGRTDALDLKVTGARHWYRIHFLDAAQGPGGGGGGPGGEAELRCESFYQAVSLLTCWGAALHSDRLLRALRTGREELDVLVGTWNLGGYAPPADLGGWLPLAPPRDVYAVGVQECVYKPKGAGKGGGDTNSDWLKRLKRHFGAEYALVASHSVVHTGAIKLAVFVRRPHAFKIRDVRWDSCGTGLGNVIGNKVSGASAAGAGGAGGPGRSGGADARGSQKGGVGVVLRVHETALLFISAHLAAHEAGVPDRNEDAASILARLRLGRFPELEGAAQAEHTFFFGDLNYRLDLPFEEVERRMNEAQRGAPGAAAARLLRADQLRREHAAGRVLAEFREAPLDFLPTYRYVVPRAPGSALLSNKHGQAPSYCDRVLWKSLPGSPPAECTAYDAAPAVSTSDHVPVSASFRVSAALPMPMDPSRTAWVDVRLAFEQLVATDVLESASERDEPERHGHGKIAPAGAAPPSSAREAAAAEQEKGGREKEARDLSVSFLWKHGFAGGDGVAQTGPASAQVQAQAQAGPAAGEGAPPADGGPAPLLRRAEWGPADVPALRPRAASLDELGLEPLFVTLWAHSRFQYVHPHPFIRGGTQHLLTTLPARGWGGRGPGEGWDRTGTDRSPHRGAARTSSAPAASPCGPPPCSRR